MKILKIRFENINSLKGLNEIDFTRKPLSSSGLFAITGPTGSGKSTILDVITLALFNRIPRISEKISRNIIEKTGLILTRNMGDCFAEIRYESKEGIFISKWSIQKARTGNLKDYVMTLAREDDTLFPISKTEVPEKNEELIGLNFDQFVKAIVLAQGDFAAFLKAKRGEREKLLEQVTGSWIYREIGRAAYNKNKELGQELAKLAERENQLKSGMLDEAGYMELLESLDKCNKEISGLNEKTKKLTEEKKLKKEIAELLQTISKNEQTESEILDGQKKFLELNGERLARHRKLIPFQKRLWEWQKLGKEVSETGYSLENIKQEIKKCADEKIVIAGEVIKLTGSDDELTKALSDFENRVTALERKKAEKDTLIKGRTENMKEAAEDIAPDVDFSDIESARQAIDAGISENNREIGALTERVGTERAKRPDEEFRHLKRLAEEAQNYKTAKAVLDEKAATLSEESETAKVIKQEIEELPEQIKNAREESDRARLIFENLEKDAKIRDLTVSLEDHRKKLVEGEPCPLCGSTDHPYTAEVPYFTDNLDEKIKKAKKENERCDRVVTTLENSLDAKTKTLGEKELRISGLTEDYEKLKETSKSILEKFPDDFRLHEPMEMIREITSAADDMESLIAANTKDKKLKDLRIKAGELAVLLKESGELAARRKEIFDGDDIHRVTSGYTRRYSSNISLAEKLEKDEKALSEKLGAYKDELNACETALSNDISGYGSLLEALDDIIEGKEYQALDEDDKRFSENLKTIRALLVEARRTLVDKKKDDTSRDQSEIEPELESIQAALTEKNLARDGFVTAKSVHEAAVTELEKITAVMEDQRKRNEKWLLLDKYIGDADGKRFSVFAQQLTLFQLIKLANGRMDVLSDRYRLDMPQEGEDDSLAVMDRHMGDLRRTVKSLSGGESFLVSLSLALALSDLASRQVEIRSLFIDEGFGSLDKLTLDQTIDTLERLQNETSKAIGVISHIEAMQERITTQIKLSRNGQGYSTVEIVG
jgi:exonuclease SbcC